MDEIILNSTTTTIPANTASVETYHPNEETQMLQFRPNKENVDVTEAPVQPAITVEEKNPDSLDDFFAQIDAFRNKAKQLQDLMKAKEVKAKELQRIVDERAGKAEELQRLCDERVYKADELQKICDEKEEQANSVTYVVEKKIDVLVGEVNDKMGQNLSHTQNLSSEMTRQMNRMNQQMTGSMDNLSEQMTGKIDALSLQMTGKIDLMGENVSQTIRDSVSESVTSSVSSMTEKLESVADVSEQLQAVKGDIYGKIHSESVANYKNLSGNIRDMELQFDKLTTIDTRIKKVKGVATAALVFGILNLFAIVAAILLNFVF